MVNGYRQEVFNVLLAQLLQERGVITAPEEVLRATPERRRRAPDIIVNFHGLRTAIEGEVDDQSDADNRALESARGRVEEGIAHISVAIVYPARLRSVAFDDLKSQLEDSPLRMAVVTEAEETGFTEASIDSLAGALRRAFDQLVQEDVVARAVAALEAGIEEFASVLSDSPGTAVRLAEILGIRELPAEDNSKPEDESE